jgi:hypothetical protein
MWIFYMNAKNWDSKDTNCLLKKLVENKIHEHKDNKINGPFYDDELENMLEEDIHNIIIQQTDIEEENECEKI